MFRRFLLGYLVVVILVLIALAAAVPAHAMSRVATGSTNYGNGAIRATVELTRVFKQSENSDDSAEFHFLVATQIRQYKTTGAGMTVAFQMGDTQVIRTTAGTDMQSGLLVCGPSHIQFDGTRRYVVLTVSATNSSVVTARYYIDEPEQNATINLPANNTGAPVTYNLRDEAGNILDSITLPAGAGAQTWSVGWQGGAATLTRTNPVGVSTGSGWAYGDGGEVVIGDVTPTMSAPPLTGTGAPAAVGWDTTGGTQGVALDKADFRTGIDALNTSIRNISISGGGAGADYTQVLNDIRTNTATLKDDPPGVAQPTEPEPEAMTPVLDPASVKTAAGKLPVAPTITPPTQQSAFAAQLVIPGSGTYSVGFDMARWATPITIFRTLCSAGILLSTFFFSLKAIRDAFAG